MTAPSDAKERLSDALTALPQTKAQRAKLPPSLLIATGLDDHVMIFLLRIGDANATANAFLGVITMAESGDVIDCLAETSGLIKKRLEIDIAQGLKETLANADTDIEFVRPVDD